MKEATIASLRIYRSILQQLTDHEYTQPLSLLGNASLGQQIRHVIEFYSCVLYTSEFICYDERPRDLRLETNLELALHSLEKIMMDFSTIDQGKAIRLTYSLNAIKHSLPTTIGRELLYCLDHAIHHAAILKIALAADFPNIEVPPTFGYAYSTINHQSNPC